MKRLLSLLMAALLLCSTCIVASADGFDAEALAGEFGQESLRLERVTLPGQPENVSWLSGSPGGRYLLGLTADALILYDREAQSYAPVQFDMSGDAKGNLQKLLERPSRLRQFTFVWSPDERYFTMYDWEMAMLSINLRIDLLLCDVQTMTVSVKRAWVGQYRDADSGTIYDACFSPDSRTLYVSFIGKAYEEYGDSFMMLAYDIAADTLAPVAVNRFDLDGQLVEAVYPGMSCLADGSIVQLATTKSRLWVVRRLVPEGDGWRSEVRAVPGDCSGRYCLFATPASNSFLVLTPYPPETSWMAESVGSAAVPDTSAYTKVLLLKVAADGALAEVRQRDAASVCLSPDGRFFIALTGDSVSWALTLYDTETGDRYAVDAAALEARREFAYLMGRNAMANDFPAGMLWCGELLLMGTEDGAALFRFAD